jgi:hypothetical protein
MCRINDAYQAIVEQQAAATPAPVQVSQGGQRLSPEEIDRLARAIGSDGPVDWALNAFSWVGNAYEAILLVVGAAIVAVQVTRAIWHRDLTFFREHPELILIVAVLVVLGVREWILRDRILQPATRDGG